MKQMLFAALLLGLVACTKEDRSASPHPDMEYRDLSDRVVNITTPAGINISGDGESEVWFDIWPTYVETQNSDIHRFVVSPGNNSKLLVNAENASPIFDPGSAIKTTSHPGLEWKAPIQVELATRTLIRNTPAPTWEGTWKNAQRKFLAVQVTKNGAVYYGWIELSFDTATEKVILYRSALSKEAGREVIAGR